ncbi:MAG: HAD family hydrolase [Candidatus Latescibacterota bacterium]|nr:HAD family hydrolase [Candidatus Latescibacterota bacterium]
MERAGFEDLFHAVLISDAVGMRKPHPKIFEELLASLGVDPEETLHVGDSLSADIAGAGELGIQTVWITRRIKNRDAALSAYAGPPPDFEVADLSELPPLLQRLDSAS